MNARGGIVVAVIVVSAVALGAWWWSVAPGSSPAGHGTLSIVTSPRGARLSIEGKSVGVTPWFSDNTWPRGAVLFELSLPGYRTWKGSFQGGPEARVNVTLARRTQRRVSDVIDGGSLDIDLEDEDDGPLHTHGPLRPPEPTEFVDDDLDREAAAAKSAK